MKSEMAVFCSKIDLHTKYVLSSHSHCLSNLSTAQRNADMIRTQKQSISGLFDIIIVNADFQNENFERLKDYALNIECSI